MTPPPHIARLCAEFGVRIIDPRRYPDVGETRAVATLDRIYRRYGEAHLRLVLTTLAETANNRACLDEFALNSVSDLVRACPEIIDRRTSEWLEVFDAAPIGELQFMLADLSGITPQRHALSGLIYERIVRRFGPRYMQPDLFDDRRKR